MFSYTDFEMLQNLETIIKTKESKGEKKGGKKGKGKSANSQRTKNHSKCSKGESTDSWCKKQITATWAEESCS